MANKINDLRSALEFLKAIPGQYVETDVEVDPIHEIASVYKYIGAGGTVIRPTKEGPALQFNNVKGFPGRPVVIGVLSSRRRVGYLLDHDPNRLGFLLKDCVQKPINPVLTDDATPPCQEVVYRATDPGFDVRKIIPASTNTPVDGGSFITVGMVYAADVETGEKDITIHRMCMHTEDEISMFFTPGARHIGAMREKAERLGKPKGFYSTVETRGIPQKGRPQRAAAEAVRKLLAEVLSACVGKKNYTALIAGLGNISMTADSLGPRVCKKLIVTRRSEKAFIGRNAGAQSLCAVSPGVLGVTGIETYDVIAGIADRVKPDIIVAADSLSSMAAERLASAFQVTDAGIAPGSGVNNHRFRLDRKTLGVPVIAVGVPLVMYASELDMIVTPKDIDAICEDCAYIIALAVNAAVHGLSTEAAIKLMHNA